MTGRERLAAAVLALCMVASVCWPMVETAMTDPMRGLSYEDATDMCAEYAAEHDAWCYVLPDGDQWKAEPGE